MKLLLPIALAWLCLAFPLLAEAPARTVQVGVEAGRLYGGSFAGGTTPYWTREIQLDDDQSKGAWVETNLTEAWGLQASVRQNRTDLITPDPGIWSSQPKVGNLVDSFYEVEAVRRYRRSGFELYWQAGGGMTNLRISNFVNNTLLPPTVQNHPELSGGGGMKFWFAPWLVFRFDLRAHATYLKKPADNLDQGTLGSGRWLRTQEVLTGLAYSF